MREHVAQGAPPDPDLLARFPQYLLKKSQRLWRVHRRRFSAWYFSSSGSGRFDLEQPYGTCYVATSDILAAVEALGPEFVGRVVPESFFRERVVTAVAAPRPARLANTCVAAAYGFGVTPELATMVPYAVPQRWAAAFHAAGFGGIRYRSRLLAGSLGYDFALFGGSGIPPRAGRAESFEPGVALYRRLRRRCGILVGTPPSVADLSVS